MGGRCTDWGTHATSSVTASTGMTLAEQLQPAALLDGGAQIPSVVSVLYVIINFIDT